MGSTLKSEIYYKFATYYDRMGADIHSREMVKYTEAILHRFGVQPRTGLDLACGTGTALKLLAEQGLVMAGLDQSEAMLKIAKKKCRGLKVKLYQQSLPAFRLVESPGRRRVRRFDLVTCFYDSLNYLQTEKELQQAYRSVYRHLAPGGWFIFDMNTPRALETVWGSNTWGGTMHDLAWIWQNQYDETERRARLQATFFVRAGQHWKRFDEIHVERGYSNAVIKRLLREEGFVVRGFYRCQTFDKPDHETNRLGVAACRSD
jgi:SAM-dependent methyltransferase